MEMYSNGFWGSFSGACTVSVSSVACLDMHGVGTVVTQQLMSQAADDRTLSHNGVRTHARSLARAQPRPPERTLTAVGANACTRRRERTMFGRLGTRVHANTHTHVLWPHPTPCSID